MDRVAVITGASRGIGLATALRLARAGYRLVVAARGAAALRAAVERICAAGTECRPVVADVGRAAAGPRLVKAALGRFGRIDLLVNNAGRAPLVALEEMSAEDFRRTVAVNVSAVFYTTRAVWPAMKAQGGGVIVNVSSLAAQDPFGGLAVYGACKAWVNLFTKAVADEGRPHNIRVYAVAPGAVETDMLRANFPQIPPHQTLAPDQVAAVIEALGDQRLTPGSGSTLWVRK